MRCLLCILLISNTLLGSQVAKVAHDSLSALVTQDELYKFQVDDKICVYRESKPIGCGIVAKTGDKLVKIIFEQKVQLQEGDNAYVVVEPSRKIASIQESSELPIKKAASYIGLGLNLALDRTFPKIEFITNVSSKVGLGIQVAGTYAQNHEKTSYLVAYGLAFTANYYAQEYYRGLWLQFGSGTYLISENSTGTLQHKDSPFISLSVGWRERWAWGFNIGISGGIRYISFPAVSNNDLNFQKLQPSLIVDFGFTM